MKTTVNFSQFCDAFTTMGRGDSFSYQAKLALYEYLEEMHEDCGIEYELDVVALDCEFCEYPSAFKCITDCGYDFHSDEDDEEDIEDECAEYLRDNTQVIEFDQGIIIASF